MRIAIAGFQHETNTFAPVRADFADFEKADAWPGLTRGQAIIDEMAGMNLPITGFVEAARAAGAELVPLLWCSAEVIERHKAALTRLIAELDAKETLGRAEIEAALGPPWHRNAPPDGVAVVA